MGDEEHDTRMTFLHDFAYGDFGGDESKGVSVLLAFSYFSSSFDEDMNE